jgi:hypothetical protein
MLRCVRDGALSGWCKSSPKEVTTFVAEGNCVAARRGGEQPASERVARRMTNPFRRRDVASLPELGEAWAFWPISMRWCDDQSDIGAHDVVGDGMRGRQRT